MTVARLVRYHDGEGHRIAIAVEGRKLLHVAVITDRGVVSAALTPAEQVFVSDFPGSFTKNAVPRAAKQMLAAGRKLGITKAAKQLLKEQLA